MSSLDWFEVTLVGPGTPSIGDRAEVEQVKDDTITLGPDNGSPSPKSEFRIDPPWYTQIWSAARSTFRPSMFTKTPSTSAATMKPHRHHLVTFTDGSQ